MVTGTGKKATTKAKMRRKTVPFGEVRRDTGGNVTMIQLKPFKDNPLAPTALVSDVGGIYRLDTHLIRCTFIDEIPNAEGVLETVATSHLVWKTEQHWLATRDVFGWVMNEFLRGAFGDGGRRRKMQ
jgi:hypothetical protein